MEEVLKGVIVKYENENVKGSLLNFKEIKKIELKHMYDLIGCDLVEAVRLPKDIDIWVDEEGLLKSGNIVIGYKVEPNEESDGFELQLAGNALFLSSDEEGNTIGLNEEQLKWIQDNVKYGMFGVAK